MTVRLQNRAAEDVEDLINYLMPRSRAAAERVPDAVERLRALLSAAPGIGESVELRRRPLAGLRKTPMPIFKRHMAYFVVADQTIEVVRILHSALDRNVILEDES